MFLFLVNIWKDLCYIYNLINFYFGNVWPYRNLRTLSLIKFTAI